MRVDWTVSNQGTGDTIVNAWTDQIVASVDDILGNGDDVTLANVTHRGLLDVGESYSRSETVAIPFSFVGDYNLYVVTDSGNSVFEDINQTNNNSAALPITVTRETPDLQVTTINVPETAQVASVIPLSWTVENFGVGETNTNVWYDTVFLSTDQNLGDNNDILLGQIRHNNVLAAGENYTATADLLIPFNAVGDYYVIVRTDESDTFLGNTLRDRVLEPDLEDNNHRVSLSQISIAANPTPNPSIIK